MKIKSFLAASIAAVALFASCSNEDDAKGIEPIEGVKTMAKITLTQTGNHTRATVAAADPEEKTIGGVRLYAFNSAGVLEAIVDFTGSTSDAFEITTGAKTFLVAANIPESKLNTVTTTLGSTTLTSIKGAISNIAVATIADAATNGKFWMTSLDDNGTATLTVATEADVNAAGGANNISITVGRAVAKVGVYFNPAVQLDGELTLVKYQIHNNPNKMRLFTSNDAYGYRVTPYYDEVGTPDADNYLKSSADYLAVEAAAFTTSPARPSYMMENSNLEPREGNATMIVIQGTFTPTVLCDADGTVSASSFSTGDVFYRVYNSTTGEYGDKYYDVVPDLTTQELVDGSYDGIAKYTGGICYYALWLRDIEKANKVDRYTVPRNTFWNVTITSVTGAGSNTDTTDSGATDPEDPDTPGPGIVEPGEPLDVDTWMKATITVADWTSVTQTGGI